MSDNSNKLLHHHTVFDGWRSISIALYMTLVGYGVLVGIPVTGEIPGITETTGATLASIGLAIALGAFDPMFSRKGKKPRSTFSG